eukprot:SAG31_NODE_2663_length_5278_cov_29.536011_2_plen_372_part_00
MEKSILQNLSGEMQAGKLLAIMGPSGSGKTSLLNTLAGRVPITGPKDRLSGEVMVDGQPQKDMAKISAYVMQDDNLFALSTVKETLLFAAKLRLPKCMSDDEKQAAVDRVIAKLGLEPAKETVIGNQKIRGISGGERKRVSIGIELLHNPPLIFLDEPTSGLDSFQAQSVVETLQNLAQNGHTVVCSLHQPRSSIYAMVDSLCLMAGGQCAYFGPAGNSCHQHFASLELAVPADFNPADHLLDVVSIDHRETTAKQLSTQRVEKILAAWEGSGAETVQGMAGNDCDHKYTEVETAEMQHKEDETLNGSVETGMAMQHGSSCSVAFPLLLARTWRELTRNKLELGPSNMHKRDLVSSLTCMRLTNAPSTSDK